MGVILNFTSARFHGGLVRITIEVTSKDERMNVPGFWRSVGEGWARMGKIDWDSFTLLIWNTFAQYAGMSWQELDRSVSQLANLSIELLV